MRDDLWRGGMIVLLMAFVAEVVWLWSLGCVFTAIFVAVFGALPACCCVTGVIMEWRASRGNKT